MSRIHEANDDILNDDNNTYMGQVIKDRFVIGVFIDAGAFGKVFKVTDKKDIPRPLVIKISV